LVADPQAIGIDTTTNRQPVVEAGVTGTDDLGRGDGVLGQIVAAPRCHHQLVEFVQQVTESTFFKRYGTLDEQVAPILFLASDESSYITGTVLPVAGGDLG